MNKPILHEDLLDILSSKYSAKISDLLGLEGLGIMPFPSTFKPKIKTSLEELNNFFYTIEFLERKHYADFENSNENNSSPVPSIAGLHWKETPDIDNLEFIEKLFAKYYDKKIIITTKFFEFINSSHEVKLAESIFYYDYNHFSSIGKLKIKNIPDISFKKLRAKILFFFYFHKDRTITDDVCKNYTDFNMFAENKHLAEDYTVKSGEFSKEIVAINKRVFKETKGMIKDLISKKENKRSDANIYHWNKNHI